MCPLARYVWGMTASLVLGHTDVSIRPIGLGCMGMSQFYGDADEHESLATIHAAIDAGIDFFDTSDIYGAASGVKSEKGFGHNEELLGRAVKGQKVVLATKFGAKPHPDGGVVLDGRPEYVAQACEIGAIGLSNVGPEILRRASAVTPISALQSEYSLWAREVEEQVLPTCRELGITFVPYSPLGRAALAGRFSKESSFADNDFRSTLPKFDGENFEHNLQLVETLKGFADERGHTPGQVALAWLLAQPYDIAPIPGTKRAEYARQNVAATGVPLSADDVAFLNDLFDPSQVRGGQYGTLDVKTS
jgi:aryl-alcohol dehydrogenase-like predicted oxidoreductase